MSNGALICSHFLRLMWATLQGVAFKGYICTIAYYYNKLNNISTFLAKTCAVNAQITNISNSVKRIIFILIVLYLIMIANIIDIGNHGNEIY